MTIVDTIDPMKVGDMIQLAIVLVMTVTLVVLVCQTYIQNQLAKAQLLRDRFDMYWRTYEPVSDEEVSGFHLNPTDYVTQEQYDTQYKNDHKAIRKVLMMSKYYEYLAFLDTLKRMGIKDPLGKRWEELWTRSFATDKYFCHIHEKYRDYYPRFAKTVDKLIEKRL